MSLILYGIPNCDTVKKARNWLDANQQDYRFHDFRKDGLSEADLNLWCNALGWEQVLNKRSTSWRALDAADKEDLDQAKAIKLMLTSPTLVKRPVLAKDDQFKTGFKDADYQAFFDL
ncbi:ArsC family reductase [Oceanospirillum linum]|uniref:ArsC family reductase n=1 Tax=Oceanospirillum linum TaxID=966 RepID=A0A1T1HFQ2_OCELI|nr:ArsC family reductase [Oceanospirillum linum]OOV88646.1 ArsC family reductase [Oceanospirillum linum]SEG04210.1 arsenate reductase [Oleiphilus messinensis]SMP21025.1 arsenate reductase [Oceanospirillum linum]